MKLIPFIEQQKENQIYVRVVASRESGIALTLVAVNILGESLFGGNLLSITNDGNLILEKSISKDIGFPLTTNTRTLIIKEKY